MVVHMTRKAQWVARVKMNKAVTAWTQQRAWRRLGGGRMGDDGAALGLRRGRIGLRLKLITYPLSD